MKAAAEEQPRPTTMFNLGWRPARKIGPRILPPNSAPGEEQKITAAWDQRHDQRKRVQQRRDVDALPAPLEAGTSTARRRGSRVGLSRKRLRPSRMIRRPLGNAV